MRRPQESFWLPAHKLKPQRGTMLLLAVKKFGVFHGIIVLSFSLRNFRREQATRQRANPTQNFEVDQIAKPKVSYIAVTQERWLIGCFVRKFGELASLRSDRHSKSR